MTKGTSGLVLKLREIERQRGLTQRAIALRMKELGDELEVSYLQKIFVGDKMHNPDLIMQWANKSHDRFIRYLSALGIKPDEAKELEQEAPWMGEFIEKYARHSETNYDAERASNSS